MAREVRLYPPYEIDEAALWQDARHGAPVLPPVHPKVAVGRQQDRVAKPLAHAHEARISKAHRYVGIFLHQAEYGVCLLRQSKIDPHRPAMERFIQATGRSALSPLS
jgi:hypothetical protein